MLNVFKRNNKKSKSNNTSIDKSLKIIKKEKEKIREEKKKIKLEKESKFYKTNFGMFLKDFFDIDDNEKYISKTIKKRIFYNLFNVFFGFILCLAVLFVLSGGKNYFKLYYELNDFIETYDTISEEYYGKFDREEVVDSAINSMVGSVGDVYTTYSNQENTDILLEDLEGTYEGIGCLVGMNLDNGIYVMEVFDGTPADKAGLLEGDIILEVDGVDYSDKTSEDVSDYVKNEVDDQVEMKLKRNNEEFLVNIIREKVEIPSVDGKIIYQDDVKIGYISIDVFSSVADKQFENKLKKMEKEDIEGLIIDVRNNTGGYLNVVTNISSLFLEKGLVIYQLKTADKVEKVKDKTKVNRKYPVVVLVNGASASASEILAASIKESYNGYVVGVNTYGKGTVQKTKTLKNGSMVKYTIQEWLTPKANAIDGKGVKPTHVIEFEESGYENDSQLDYSIDLLKKDIIEKK